MCNSGWCGRAKFPANGNLVRASNWNVVERHDPFPFLPNADVSVTATTMAAHYRERISANGIDDFSRGTGSHGSHTLRVDATTTATSRVNDWIWFNCMGGICFQPFFLLARLLVAVVVRSLALWPLPRWSGSLPLPHSRLAFYNSLSAAIFIIIIP